MSNHKNSRTVHELQFNVAQLLKEATGASRSYNIVIESIDRLDAAVEFVSPLTGQIKFLRTGQDILVSGRLETTIKTSCDRCLVPFTTPISVELEEIFFPTIDLISGHSLPPPPEADEANRIDDQHILNLNEVVRQAIVLENDAVRYCRPDCKGLCPICGQDRNVTSCDCAEEAIDWRWADLQALREEF